MIVSEEKLREEVVAGSPPRTQPLRPAEPVAGAGAHASAGCRRRAGVCGRETKPAARGRPGVGRCGEHPWDMQEGCVVGHPHLTPDPTRAPPF